MNKCTTFIATMVLLLGLVGMPTQASDRLFQTFTITGTGTVLTLPTSGGENSCTLSLQATGSAAATINVTGSSDALSGAPGVYAPLLTGTNFTAGSRTATFALVQPGGSAMASVKISVTSYAGIAIPASITCTNALLPANISSFPTPIPYNSASPEPIVRAVPTPMVGTPFVQNVANAGVSHSYSFSTGGADYGKLICNLGSLDGVTALGAYINIDPNNSVNSDSPISGLYLGNQTNSTLYSASIQANGPYLFDLNGALNFNLAVTSAGSSSSNVTVSCRPITDSKLPMTYDPNGNQKVSVVNVPQVTLQTTPNPGPTANPGGEYMTQPYCPVGTTITGNSGHLSCRSDSNGDVYVVQATPMPTVNSGLTTYDNNAAIPTGNGAVIVTAPTANSYFAYQCPGRCNTVEFRVSGLTAGTPIYTEASVDATSGSNGGWTSFNTWQMGNGQTPIGSSYSLSSNGLYQGNVAGATWIRFRAASASVGLLTTAPTFTIQAVDMDSGKTTLINGAPNVYGSQGIFYPIFGDNPANSACNSNAQPSTNQALWVPGLPCMMSSVTTTAAPIATAVLNKSIVISRLDIYNTSATQTTLVISYSAAAGCTSSTTVDTIYVPGGSQGGGNNTQHISPYSPIVIPAGMYACANISASVSGTVGLTAGISIFAIPSNY